MKYPGWWKAPHNGKEAEEGEAGCRKLSGGIWARIKGSQEHSGAGVPSIRSGETLCIFEEEQGNQRVGTAVSKRADKGMMSQRGTQVLITWRLQPVDGALGSTPSESQSRVSQRSRMISSQCKRTPEFSSWTACVILVKTFKSKNGLAGSIIAGYSGDPDENPHPRSRYLPSSKASAFFLSATLKARARGKRL